MENKIQEHFTQYICFENLIPSILSYYLSQLEVDHIHTHTHTHEISLLHIELKYTVTPSSSSVRTHSQLNRETYIANSQETHHSSYLESFIVN